MQEIERTIALDATDRTPHAIVAERIVDLMVREEKSLTVAAREVGVSLRFAQGMSEEIRAAVAQWISTHTLEEDVQKALVHARLNEMLMSPDPEIVIKAIKEVKGILGMDKPAQVELSLRRPAEADSIEEEAARR